MNFHPAAEFMPMMTAVNWQSHLNSIKTHGQLEPIDIFQGMILDGRHRWKACQELGLECKTREVEPANPLDYVITKNLPRRHLETGQRAALAAKYKMEVVSPKMKQGKRNNNRWTPKDQCFGRGSPAAKVVGLMFGIGQSAVERAEVVFQKDLKIFQALLDGWISLNRAYCQVTHRAFDKSTFKIPPKVWHDSEAHAVVKGMQEQGWILEARFVHDGWLAHFFGNGERPWVDINWTNAKAGSFKDVIVNAANEVALEFA